MPDKKKKSDSSIRSYLILLFLALIAISGVFVCFLNKDDTALAQVDPDILAITNTAPSLGGKWQTDGTYPSWRYRKEGGRPNQGIDYEYQQYNCPNWYKTYEDDIVTYDANGIEISRISGPFKEWVLNDSIDCDRNYRDLEGNLEGNLNDYPQWGVKDADNLTSESPTPQVIQYEVPFPQPAADILAQEPFLVVGDDGENGKGDGFYDRTLEMEVWIPEGTINQLTIQPIGLCHGGDGLVSNDDWDNYVNAGEYTDIYIKGKNNKLLLILGNNRNCTQNTVDLSTLEPLEKKVFFTSIFPSGQEYEGYRIIAEATTTGSYVNQFNLEITNPANSYMTVAAAGTENSLDPDVLENLNTLNISNRLPQTSNSYNPPPMIRDTDPYKRLQILWETIIYIAPDAKDGCSNMEEKIIGIYDGDYPKLAQSWMQSGGYPLKMDIYAADRNEYLNKPDNALFKNPKDPNDLDPETLIFDGYINEGDKEPDKYLAAPSKYVGGNNWEDKGYEFHGDKIYKIRLYNIDQRTWIQIRLPYSQINAIEKCLRKPLVKVYYSDISAGGRFGFGENLDACINQELINPSPPIEASVYTHAEDLRFNSTAWGSSAQYGARVHDEIIGFYSDFPSPTGKSPPNSLKGLTFANNDASIAWGGQFGGRARCMPNYWRGAKRMTDTASPATTLDIGTITTGTPPENNVEKLFKPNGLFTLTNTAPAVDLGLKATIYVEGDLIIKSDIYNNDSTTFNKFNEMGYIYLIAKGDILIDPSVTHIDAVLVAYSEDSITGGRIFTCNFDTTENINLRGPDPNIVNKSREYDEKCNQKLIINGALIGREIHLGRIYCETLSSTCSSPTTDQVGEEINLSPEYFVSTPQLPEFSEWLYNSDSITILPTNF